MFKIFSVFLSSLALILVNISPLFHSLELWESQEIILYYWVELAILGFFCSLKILFIKDDSMSQQGKKELSLVFPVMWFFSYIFVFIIVVTSLDLPLDPVVIKKGVAFFGLSHGVSFLLNFVINKEYLSGRTKNQLFFSISQFITFTLIIWMLSIGPGMPNYSKIVVFIILVKTLISLAIHFQEHGIRVISFLRYLIINKLRLDRIFVQSNE